MCHSQTGEAACFPAPVSNAEPVAPHWMDEHVHVAEHHRADLNWACVLLLLAMCVGCERQARP
jgi:hypothetical protein